MNAAALPSWEHYYDHDLGWYKHVRNVLNHLPMMDAIRRTRPQRVLEVGTGTGSLAIFLSYFGLSVTSVDLSPMVLERATRNSRRLCGRAHFAIADAFALDEFEDQSFDVAISQGFFEHFSDDEITALLAQQLRVARTAIFSVPNALYGQRDRGDERLLTRPEWETLVRGRGFRLSESFDYRVVTPATIASFGRRTPPTMYLAVVTR